jgi:ABC-type nitrate/sulfonate/bicarbonate transport system permease component
VSNLLADLAISSARVLFWTGISFGLGVLLGYLGYAAPKLNRLMLPIVNFFRHISPFCWLPLIILVAGIGEWPVGIVLLFSMLFNAIIISTGIFQSVQGDILDTAALDGASRQSVLRYIQLPLALPDLVNLYRILWSVAWTAIIAAEMLGVQSGLGYRLLDFRYLLQYREMLQYIAVIGGIGIAADYLLLNLQKRISAYLYQSRDISTQRVRR